MDREETVVCGRDKEIKEIHNFISTRIQEKKSGILYITGPPGTGKTMSIQIVLDQLEGVPKIHLNCMKLQSSKCTLTKLCQFVKLPRFEKFSEPEIISRLAKKFAGRTCETHIIVLDEMDNLPKSKTVDLIRTIFSWPNQEHSKLILIGLANTVNLTSRYQTISSILGKDYHQITKILFKPYTSNDIKEILQWYLKHDENFEDASLEPKALDMIAARAAREKGDIRGALNALKSAIVDSMKTEPEPIEQSHYPTPPSTPPLSPIKSKTNLASVANSVKKRQKVTHFMDDQFPFPHQIILTCLIKLCSKGKTLSVNLNILKNLVERIHQQFSIHIDSTTFISMLDSLEVQGFIGIKKIRPHQKIILKANEIELEPYLKRKDMIMDLINQKA